MSKQFFEWYGGPCPIPKGTLVDVKYRSGATEYSLPALEDIPSDSGLNARNCFWFHNAHQQDIIAWRLHEPEQAAWNGEGMPPAGTECEVKRALDWQKCKIIFISEYHAVMGIDFSEICWQTQACQFRPIRTEAERKRELACKAMTDRIEMDNCLAEIIYDDIAAGKIPGVKIE